MYARTVLAIARCPSVCLCLTSRRCSVETDERIVLIFLTELLPFTIYYNTILVPPKIRLVHSGNLFQTLKKLPRQVDGRKCQFFYLCVQIL